MSTEAVRQGRPSARGRLPSFRRDLLSWTGPQVPPWAIVVVAGVACLVVGRYLPGSHSHKKYAIGIILAAIYGPVVFFDLALGLAVWASVQFVQDLRVLSSAPNAMGVVVGLGWLGTFLARSGRLEALKGHRAVLLTGFLFGTWMTLSCAWAQSPSTAANIAGFYWLGLLALVVVLTSVRTSREASVIALAFVIGGTLAALVGLFGGSLTVGRGLAQATTGGRITGGGGDPNLQGAALVASLFVATGLLGLYPRRAAKIGLSAAFILITIAFIKTGSRGGLFALLAATLVALIVSPDQRKRICQLAVMVCAVAALVVAVTPGALSRITDFGGGTSGRNDIWRVAVLVFEHHPVIGVGANNFSVVEPNYALAITNASRIQYIAEQPQQFPAHNSYLQMLADVGIIGLIAYLAAVSACLRAGWQAARLFERIGQRAHAQLARSCLMGAVGFLTANFFITNGWDWRLWMLLGLGPALLALARRISAEVPAPSLHDRAGQAPAPAGQRSLSTA